MTLSMILRVSLRALVRNKLRSFLTALGIIIGVAAVISMVAIGNGARTSIQQNIASLGTNVLFVSAGSTKAGGVHGGGGSGGSLTVNDIRACNRECSALLATSPLVSMGAQCIFQNQNWSTQVNGCAPDYLTVRNWSLRVGRIFGDDEIRAAAKVCVLGQVVVTNLFGNEDPIGQSVRVRSIPFRVIGVLTEKGSSGMGDQDDVVLVPYTSALKRLQRSNRDSIQRALVSACSADEVEVAKNQISSLLRQRHNIAAGDEDDFTIRTQAEYAQMMDASTRVFSMLLGGIASVSLLVGGIGIMNIMLVSVTERIREIGIRMALGARALDILMQFLVEAMLLSLLGGLVGIMVGYVIAYLASFYSAWPPVVSPESVFLSFGFSALVGIFFGLYPAVKASRLDPIVALRQE
jgi:putative ABC transport system permease protein